MNMSCIHSSQFCLQSSLVQVVEYHAQQASMRLDKGTEELEKARDHKVKSLKVILKKMH